jgi:hypothetical protein
MAARLGMLSLIASVRGKAAARSDETTIDAVTYWTDDQLQAILDQFSYDVTDVALRVKPYMVDGVTVYREYYIPNTVPAYLEGAETDDAFLVVDSRGFAAPAYTYDGNLRKITLAVSGTGTEYYLRAKAFDLDRAVAEVWLQKAGHRADLITWKAGTYTLEEDTEYAQCMAKYHEYLGKGRGGVVTMNRVDYANSIW